MKFKKTIAAVALTASSAFALIGPGSDAKTYCLNTFEGADGGQYVGACDESANNKTLEAVLLENGCAAGQSALTTYKSPGASQYSIKIASCLPPHVVQL